MVGRGTVESVGERATKTTDVGASQASWTDRMALPMSGSELRRLAPGGLAFFEVAVRALTMQQRGLFAGSTDRS